MSSSSYRHTTPGPSCWQDFANGEHLQMCLQQALSPWWPRLFGYHLLKLGPLSAAMDASHSSISHQICLHDAAGASVVANTTQLPLRHASVDVVLANFLLEFEANPYQLLREIDRVLISGGTLILSGFNPLSPAILGKLLPRYQHVLPWRGHFYLPSRVKDWLALLGYQVICDERLVYHPLFGHVDKGLMWQHGLESWLPGSGSVFLLVARKLDSPLTPVREKRKARKPHWQTIPSAGRVGRSHPCVTGKDD
ncbi:class I SAM-dependent methyltransferase [Shewanella sp. GXUN23E]|uniref:class I SAM-dependent methyltransferase n=1 Tax=Shewanella sp. GXUN23E TaxID=3422498 RepID=UPI003D7DACBB